MKAKRKTGESPVRFFHREAAYSWTPDKETKGQGRWRGARALASAEVWAAESGVSYEWGIDPFHDSSDFSNAKPAWQLWACCARDAAGKVIASLCEIDFGRDGEPWGQPYRRVVQAELALEVMPD